MNWPALVATALTLWGWAFPPNIIVLDEPERPDAQWLAFTTFDDSACYIHVYSATWNPAYDPLKIVTHEVGHCLSLGHHDNEGIMNGVYGDYEFSVYDRMLFWRVHPAPYRVAVPMVGQ